MATEIFLSLKKGGTCSFIFEKTIITPPPRPPMPSLAIKKFQSPSDGGVMSNGNRIFLVAI
jgi:hypothetical protein